MSYAVCRMQKVKSAGLKGMQFHNQRERKSRTNDDIDHERTRDNSDSFDIFFLFIHLKATF